MSSIAPSAGSHQTSPQSVPSTHGVSVTVATRVVDTLALLDYAQEITGATQVILLGVSQGTMVALVVAERYPERVAGLVLPGLIYKTSGASLEVSLLEAAKASAGYAFTTEGEWPELCIPTATQAVTARHQAQFGTAYAYPLGPSFEGQKLLHATAMKQFQGCVLLILIRLQVKPMGRIS